MVGVWPVWPKDPAPQQEAPVEMEVGAFDLEALEEQDVEDKADDPPQVIYRLVQF
jgi:hypothetical protein